MITRSLMAEIETALLLAHSRVFKQQNAQNVNDNNFLQAAGQKDALIRELMPVIRERRNILEKEILKGGYQNYEQVAEEVYRFMESKLRMELTGPGSSTKVLERSNFEKLARKIKSEAQTIFFKNYSSH